MAQEEVIDAGATAPYAMLNTRIEDIFESPFRVEVGSEEIYLKLLRPI